ncbi:MAG TPA: crotonase/enoyl-CoA hydratase family protein [Acidimicrobiales bacterium]|nr:crotonase/enoyl-CoA hydratase family protein [Acidimicrobiales bacterium]
MVRFEKNERVGVIIIDRPEAKNAVNGDVASGIEAAIDELEADDDLWVGVLASSGDVFCAGADLKAINAGQAGSLQTERGGFAGFVRRERDKPVIAAVDGPALAGGCELVLACDLVVASKNARFGLPEVKRSLVAAAGGLFRLPRVLPRAIAMEIILTGEPLSAERAYHHGLINELVEPGDALDGALALAGRMSANAPLAVRESRKIVLAAHDTPDDELWAMSANGFAALIGTEDFMEGPRAFIEKRAPEWKGR